MPAFFQNGILNEGNTPAAKTGTLAARPAATTVSEGTIYVSYDTQEIFTSQGGTWVKVSGGGGGGGGVTQIIAGTDVSISPAGGTGAVTINNTNLTNNLDGVLGRGERAVNKNIYLQNVPGTSPSNYMYLRFDFRSILSTYVSNNGLHRATIGLSNINSTPVAAVEGIINQGLNENTWGINADNNGKNIIGLEKKNGSAAVFRRFNVTANYSDGNKLSLIESTNAGQDTYEIQQNAQSNALFLRVGITLNSISQSAYTQINQSNIVFNSNATNNCTLLPSFSGSNILANMPEYNGIIANINERISDNNVDLSAGNYTCSQYGVYVVTTGDNTNTFDLDQFVGNATDGQFITICAQDTPVKCTNTAGNFYGTANINSTGLFKLMKVGNDIYSSHI